MVDHPKVREGLTKKKLSMSNTFKDKTTFTHLSTCCSAMQRATVVQLHYVVVVGPVMKIKTGFRGFKTEQNPGFRKCTDK